MTMIEDTAMPEILISAISTENKDFAVKAGRAQPFKKSLSLVLFGLAWTAFTSIFVITFLGPLFLGNEVHFTSNDVPVVASPENLTPLLAPAAVIIIFVIIGIAMLLWGFYLMFKKGGYFVGTPTRLVHYYKGNIRSIDWEQFSGDIEVNGNEQKGDISLKLRTGKMVSRKNRPDEYVPDVIYISEIPSVYKIEEICRKRIKENDPTPPDTSRYQS